MGKSISSLKPKIIRILRQNEVVKAGIFGSYARGQEKKKSDIDIVIQFKGRKSLLDLIGLEMELEKKIGKKVDLLTYKSINPLLRKNILHDEVRII